MNKIKSLEGLRGIAAIMVLISHMRLSAFFMQFDYLKLLIVKLDAGTFFESICWNLLDLVIDGHLAVWIFWCMSSYVLSIRFFDTDKNYDKLIINYLSKRYIRLLIPIFASVMLAYLLHHFGLMYNLQLATIYQNTYNEWWLSSFYTYDANFLFALYSSTFETFFQYNMTTSYNPSLWTIHPEFFGSLFTFAIFGVLRHNKKRYLFYFILLFLALKLESYWLVSFIFGHILCDANHSNTRITGKLKSKYFKTKLFKIISLWAIIFTIIYSHSLLRKTQIPQEAHNLIRSIFVVYVCLKNKFLVKLFSSKFPMFLGKISFSLYLIHIPIICSLTSYLIIQNTSFTGKLSAFVITLPILLVGSVYFQKYIDMAAIRLSRKVGEYFERFTD
jgi:peptidoglycan/LPS O-acetylase OafA/YrhL